MSTTVLKSPTVLLVEDHQVLRLGLRMSLESLGCCEILGEVADGEAAVREALRLRPEIVLMDVGLPGIDGIEATWRIKQELPRTRILMLTSHTSQDYVTAALGAGADGYCSKDAPVERIASAMQAVMSGGVWLDPTIANALALSQKLKDESNAGALSEMQMQILKLIQDGMDNHQIAARLNLTSDRVALLMHKIIDRFVADTENDSKLNKRPSSKQWLTGLQENQNEGKSFVEKYLMENLLGTGALGAVYKAKHMYMDRYVALKLLRPEFCSDRLAMRYFQREAMAISSLQHENIVGLHDFGISNDGQPYLVMEYIEGISLSTILEKEKRLATRRTIDICLQVCAGLEEAHSKGIVHCDLKPSNILTMGSQPHEVVKIVDFGLAQIMPTNNSPESRSTDRFFVTGTPCYMSPEQCAGTHLEAPADIYSLGCILYEALTGVNVFEGATAMETITKQCQLIPPAMSSIYPGGFSSELEACVGKMLAKAPFARQQSIREVIDVLDAIQKCNETLEDSSRETLI